MMAPTIVGEEVRQLKVLRTDAGKTLIEHDDIDMLPRGDAARKGLGDSTHTVALAVMADPKWPVHDVILGDCEPGHTVGWRRFQANLRDVTQHLCAAEARQPVACSVTVDVGEAEDVAVLLTRRA
jgi:hypothetical protein